MSSPPEYQSLLQRDPDEHRDEDSKTPHVYPPAAGASDLQQNGESSSSVKPGVTTVHYTFGPRWPIKGDAQNALGLLYPSREASAEALQRIFPVLDEYDTDRVEILAQMEDTGTGIQWGVIMDDAWPHLTDARAPKRLWVRIKDLPGDEERRQRHFNRIEIIKVSSVVGGFVIFACLMGLGFYFDNKHKQSKGQGGA